MKRLINLFVDICLLRAAPQDLPVAAFLVTVTLILNLLTGTVVIIGQFNSLVPALLAQVMDLALLTLLVRLGLNYQQRVGRFNQAMSALFGSGVLINLVAMPVQLMIGDDPRVSPLGGLGVMLYVALVVWGIMVTAHVLRHTFEIRFGNGMLLSMGYFILINWLVGLVLSGGG